MKNSDVQSLRMLGYQDAKTPGAVLYHPRLHGLGRYVWESDAYQDVMLAFASRLSEAVKDDCEFEYEFNRRNEQIKLDANPDS